MKMTMEELKDSLDQLEEMERKTPEVYKRLDSEYWMIEGLKDLYEMCKDYSQTEVPDMTGKDFEYATRVILSKTYFDEFLLEKLKADTVYFCGFFIAVKGCFISSDVMKKYFNVRINNPKIYMNPDDISKLGLPSDVKYTTIKRLSNGCGFALVDDDLNEAINSWSKYEFLEI